jgi:hypothetical protein
MNEVKREYPPNIEDILEHFPDAKTTDVLFAYAPHIYAPRLPALAQLPPQLYYHELVHIRQQGDNPELWWERYFQDKQFRLEQEFEAHYMEYLVLKNDTKNRHDRRNIETSIAKKLASRLYGNMITLKRAKEALRKGILDEQVQRN